jgi:hypothetical protein
LTNIDQVVQIFPENVVDGGGGGGGGQKNFQDKQKQKKKFSNKISKTSNFFTANITKALKLLKLRTIS